MFKNKLIKKLNDTNMPLYTDTESTENLDYLLEALESFIQFQPNHTSVREQGITFSNMFVFLSVGFDETHTIVSVTARNYLNDVKVKWNRTSNEPFPGLFDVLD